MKTYTFKIKVDFDKVVVAVNMQFEQFFDSVKLTDLKELCERYPYAYITASDYHSGTDFISSDICLSSLKAMLDSKDLKSYLLNQDFYGFVGDDSFNKESSEIFANKAHNFIYDLETCKDADIKEDEEVKEYELSETNKE